MTTCDRIPPRRGSHARRAAWLGLALAAGTAAAVTGGFRIAVPDYAWSFPRDHWAHEGYRTEWWYFTGHLDSEGPEAGRFGYQFTLFRIGLLPARPPFRSGWAASGVAMGHAAVSDLERREHRFSETVRREVPLLASFGSYPDPEIARVQGPPGTSGEWTLRWNGDGFDLEARDDARRLRLSLSTRPERPAVLQGPNGLSRKGNAPGAASQYYSVTRLATRGTVVLDGREFRVAGESWMDREFGSSQLSEEQVGWDWFALRLDDGRDLMLYALRDRRGEAGVRNGSLVRPGGGVRLLEAADWSVRPLSTWTSGVTGATYPARWRIEIPSEGLALVVVPDFPEQENVARTPRAPFYWEGSVSVLDGAGGRAGRGYVELTGYGERNRPPV